MSKDIKWVSEKFNSDMQELKQDLKMIRDLDNDLSPAIHKQYGIYMEEIWTVLLEKVNEKLRQLCHIEGNGGFFSKLLLPFNSYSDKLISKFESLMSYYT